MSVAVMAQTSSVEVVIPHVGEAVVAGGLVGLASLVVLLLVARRRRSSRHGGH